MHLFSPTRWLPGSLLLLLVLALRAPQAQAGAPQQDPNPTPIVITLTPTPAGEATPLPSPTAAGGLPPDRFEPNDEPLTAALLARPLESDLTLPGSDVDFFTSFAKAGQIWRFSSYVREGLDTRLQLYWAGQLVGENDDRSPTDVGSTLFFTAPADGWLLLVVSKVTQTDGRYDLEGLLVEATATPTGAPTLTATPTLTPTPTATPRLPADAAEPNDSPAAARPVTPGQRATYSVGDGDVDYFTFIAKAGRAYSCETVTEQVDTQLTLWAGGLPLGMNDDRAAGRVDSFLSWTAVVEQVVVVQVEARGGSFGAYELLCQADSAAAAPAGPGQPGGGLPPTPTPFSGSSTITLTQRLSLTLRSLGQAAPPTTPPLTHIRVLVYYDANNDRSPGPGEGVANVSVLAVDAQGQRIARVFTNGQGEAVFNLASETLARVIVPFVPGWSARLRLGEANNDIVLGLPAVRLPVFLPVQNRPNSEESRDG